MYWSIFSPCLAIVKTHSAKPNTQMFDSIDGILLGQGKSRMLVQSSAILFWHTIAMLNVQSDDTNFVGISKRYVWNGTLEGSKYLLTSRPDCQEEAPSPPLRFWVISPLLSALWHNSTESSFEGQLNM